MGMTKPLLAAIPLVLVLAACGGGFSARLNPLNWFGGSEEVQATTLVSDTVAQDPRPLVQQVTFLAVEPMQGGAIVRATGLPPTQGYWNAELVARPVEDGVLVYDFRLVPPPAPAAVSTQQSREVQVAAFVSNFKLDGISQITVQAASNARSSRR